MTATTAQARHQAGLYRVTGTPVAASIVVSLCDQLDALTLAFETERDAANLYAKQVAHWIGKNDALLEQQLAAQAAQPAPRRLTEAEITLLVEAYYEDFGSAPPDLIRQVEGLIFGDAQLRAAINAKESK